MRFQHYSIVLLLFCLLTASCSGTRTPRYDAAASPDVNDTRFNYVVSRVQRASPDEVPKETILECTNGNIDFTFDLYHQLKSSGGNLVFSPYSITSAMAMLYAGSAGDAEREISDVFHFTMPQEDLHSAFNAIDMQLKTIGMPRDPNADRLVIIDTANAIWGPPDDFWHSDYLDTLARYYGSGLREINIAADPETARLVINDWVSENTKNRIPQLLAKDELLSESTYLVLTNAIYFKAKWELPFSEADTKPADFHLLNGSEVTVDMMEFNEKSMTFQRCVGDGWTALELPYDTDGFQGNPWVETALSMILIIPDEGRFHEIEDSLGREFLKEIIDTYNTGPVHFFMPKFRYRFHVGLRSELEALGMDKLFYLANLSNMTDTPGLFVRNVIHEAFISVDEKGTEAAAATAIGVDCLGGELLELTIDRPFIYVIRENHTGTLLFAGRVLNPSEMDRDQ